MDGLGISARKGIKMKAATNRLLLMAALAPLIAGMPEIPGARTREPDWWGDRQEPDNRGRRAEKDAAALAKAEAKRQRKAAKRLRNMTEADFVEAHG